MSATGTIDGVEVSGDFGDASGVAAASGKVETGSISDRASITADRVSKRSGYVTGATINVDGGSDFV